MRLYHLFRSLPYPHQICIGVALVMMSVLLLIPSQPVQVSKHTQSQILEAGIRYPLVIELNDVTSSPLAASYDDETWASVTVKSGDTLARIFKRIGFSPRETYLVTQSGDLAKQLVSLRPGEKLEYTKSDDGKLKGLRYELSANQTLYITKDAEASSFAAALEESPVEIRTQFAHGEISSSFWNAGVKAGLTDNLIMRLAGIFGWDIDFAMELRKGDWFNVVFEEHYIDGEFIGYGDIVAAEFVNQGEQFQAIMHADGNYYTPEGRSMRKSFLRAPVNFRYVSSNFTKARFHPVQKRWKAHRGTDYVAAVGTPIMAAGDGKVIRAGYDKFNGHHVFIQHGEKYTTKYLHFKKRAVKKGDFVKQGQTVGYLGSSGMVTGAHLHYEFLVDGVHRNPRTVDLPKAQPIAKSERAAFNAIAAQRQEELDASKRVMLAMLGSGSTQANRQRSVVSE